MADVHDSVARRRNMRAIKAQDTRPELKLRSLLHRNGFRFRVCPRYLCGKPDIWMAKWNCAVFVHGCFWHAHECQQFRWPETRKGFWKHKLLANRLRDQRVYNELASEGHRVLVVWECSLVGKRKISAPLLLRAVKVFIYSNMPYGELDSDGLRISQRGS